MKLAPEFVLRDPVALFGDACQVEKLSECTTIPDTVKQYQILGAQKLLSGPALTGVSPLKDMLAVSRLTDTQQQQFATLAQGTA